MTDTPDKAQREALPKAALFWFRWLGSRRWKRRFIYTRCANAAIVFVGCVEVGWRLPWLPHVARALHPEVFAVRTALKETTNE